MFFVKKSLILLTAAMAGGIFAISNNISTPVIANAATEETSSSTEESDGISDSLRTAIATKEGIDVSAVTKDYLGTLTGTLDLSNQNISDLSGIQYADSLTGLNVSSNEISDISVLGGLTNLTSLDISFNLVKDFGVLNKLFQLDKCVLGQQSIMAPDDYMYGNSATLNIYDFVDANADKNSVEIDGDMVLSPTGADINYSDASKIKITNKDNSSVQDIGIPFSEKIQLKNGSNPIANMILSKRYNCVDYMPQFHAKDITIDQGDKWDPEAGIEDASYLGKVMERAGSKWDSTYLKDHFGYNDNSFISVKPVQNQLDTNKLGTYKVEYYSPLYEGFIYPTTSTVTVKPKENNSSSVSHSDSNVSDISDIKKTLLITKKSDSIPIYDQNGRKISDKSLSKLTTFNTTEKNVIDDNTYYEIANDQWVKSDSVREYTKESGVLQSKSDSYKQLLNADGIKLNRGLKQTTDWLYDGYAEFNGTKYYRVATDEWVKADDVILIKGVKGVVKANTQATLYKDTGDQSNRALAKNSTFVTDKISKTIDNETMYRVATDEWVKASDVTFTQK